ncbi:hypothetical protein CFO_g5433 [Ceratocystis platani]|uniref:Jacalin-type lectin domain-containing protein n=1 Tax=Ceratocystis fimbriata f. sp. platani TaxID=88771 RepID=A0A0F8AWE5_CERFI|nr:hypothetical protein CFO_g5433 [Ceratocystis platani]
MKYSTIVTIAAISTPSLVQAASGTINVLTMNVGGKDVPGDKTVNSRTIGSHFAKLNYDVINIQSDFDSHDAIYETDNHGHRTTTSGGAGKGDGLNTLSNLPFIDFRRVKWDKCSNAEGGDCDTRKGFTFMRMRAAEGVYIDMYNLQTDGGMQGDDVAARSANLAQVSEYIKKWSGGNAVMVFGDTNSIFSRTSDNINVFGDQNGMSDAWYTLVRKGNTAADISCSNPANTLMCELGDKVISRGSELLTLDASTFEYVGKQFVQPDGSVLSDRDPVQVSLTWSQSETLRQSDLYGAPHGEVWFNDAPAVAAKGSRPKVASLGFAGGNRVDKVSVTLNDGTLLEHGGKGGDWKSLNLEVDEFWVTADLCQGDRDGKTRIFYIKATTSKNNKLEVGKTTDACQTYSAPSGFQIIGFAGQAGDEIDQLCVIYGLQ